MEEMDKSKSTTQITEEDYLEMCKYENGDIDIANVEFREATAIKVCEEFDIKNFMSDDNSCH